MINYENLYKDVHDAIDIVNDDRTIVKYGSRYSKRIAFLTKVILLMLEKETSFNIFCINAKQANESILLAMRIIKALKRKKRFASHNEARKPIQSLFRKRNIICNKDNGSRIMFICSKLPFKEIRADETSYS